MKVNTMKAAIIVSATVTTKCICEAAADTDLPPCGDGVNSIQVTCVAKNGHTEDQWPKTYGAPEGTDCSAIPLPTADPKFPHWRECLRTVEFGFGWQYEGTEDSTLVSIHREIANSLNEYPEERVGLAENHWGSTVYRGVGLQNTFKQIVVDICEKPITYVYSLDVVLTTPDNITCRDTASYTYEITADYAATQGYSQYRQKAASSTANRVPSVPGTGTVDCCQTPEGKRNTRKCMKKVKKCGVASNVERCIRRKREMYKSCCDANGQSVC